MPVETGLTDALLVKLFHTGKSDKEIAREFGISIQAVSKRRVNLNLRRKVISREVNDWLSVRWDIWTPAGILGHHNAHAAKALKIWLRLQLGDEGLSEKQKKLAHDWVRERMERDEVVCYDRDLPKGWYYRPRTAADGWRIIDWPAELPFPDPRFKKALDLPPQAP